MEATIVGTLCGFFIGIAIVAAAAWFFWNRAKAEPLRVLKAFAQAHGLTVVDDGKARCEVAGLLHDLHTNLVVTLGDPPGVRCICRLPQALPYPLRAVSDVAGRHFADAFTVEAGEEARRDALTGTVRDALMQLRAHTEHVELTDEAITWTATATQADLRRLPALHSMGRGVIMALGQR